MFDLDRQRGLLEAIMNQAHLAQLRIVNNASREKSAEARAALAKVTRTMLDLAAMYGFGNGERLAPLHIRTEVAKALNPCFRAVAVLHRSMPDLLNFLVGEDFITMARENAGTEPRSAQVL